MKILKVFGKRVGRLYISDHTPEMDASRLPRDACQKAGIRVHEPSIAHFVEAVHMQHPRALSNADRLNVIIARDMPATLVTNDRLQREFAGDHGVEVIWGLNLVEELVKVRKLTDEAAISVLQRIRDHNPRYVSDDIVKRFIAKMKAIGSRTAMANPSRRTKTPSPRAKR